MTNNFWERLGVSVVQGIVVALLIWGLATLFPSVFIPDYADHHLTDYITTIAIWYGVGWFGGSRYDSR